MKVKEVSELTGLSIRTLHYYDEIGLVSPCKDEWTNYREYSEDDIEKLHQIMLYKKLHFSLSEIKQIMTNPEFDLLESLNKQRKIALQKQLEMTQIVHLIDQMIDSKGDIKKMAMDEKFEAFKKRLIDSNEEQYGNELREKYEEEDIMASYQKVKAMTKEQYDASIQLEKQLFERLKEAMQEEEVAEDLQLEIAELHKRWLCFYWKEYNKNAHFGLAQMYTMDERFQKYYDSKVGDGATSLLVQCIETYIKKFI